MLDKAREITKEEFEEFAKRNDTRANYGQNQILLTEAANGKYFELKFESDKKAQSKQTALYVARRKLVAQVSIVRKGSRIAIGPGKYLPSNREAKKR